MPVIREDISILAHRVITSCRDMNRSITAVESCTGGLLCSALTSVSGASDVFEGGFVTYSNAFKMRVLGVPQDMIEIYGAVSEETAYAMAESVRAYSDADLGLAVTGIAGPGGGTIEKPVGLVHIACAVKGAKTVHKRCFFTPESHQNIAQHRSVLERENIRLLSVRESLEMAMTVLQTPSG